MPSAMRKNREREENKVTLSLHKKRSLGLGFCILAAFFLFNPNISIIDIFPDFIGYILLSVAFSKVAELNESVAGAVAGFRKMILVDLCKLVAVFWVFGMAVPSERNSSLLLWSFVFATLEMIFAVPAYIKLFDGLTQIGYLNQNESLFGDPEGSGKKSRTDRVKKATVFMVAAKGLLSVLPELSDVTNSSYDEGSGFVNLYRFIGVMRFLAFLPMLVIGIVWLCRFVRYFKTLRRDSVLCEGLLSRYETEILPKTGMFIRRRFKSVMAVLIAALLLTLDLRLEYVNMIPDFLAAGVMIAAMLMMKKDLDLSPKTGWIGMLCYLFASGAEAICERYFFANYSYYSIVRSLEAENTYFLWIGLSALKNLAFFFAILSLVRCLRRTVDLHTGFVAGREVLSDREMKMVSDVHRELKGGVTLAVVFAALYGVADICYVVLARWVEFMGLIQVVMGALAIVLFVRALWAIGHGVDTKYMLS